jgi:hypothetical protein
MGAKRAERPEEGAPGVREDRGGSAPSQAQPHKKVFKLAVPCTSAPALGTSRSYVERGSAPSLVGRSGPYRNIAPQRAGQPSQEVRNWPISIDADAKRLPTCRGPEAQERQGAPGPPVVGSPRTVSPAIANGDSGPRTPDRCIGVPLHPAARATRTTRGAGETRAGAPGRRLGLARLRCPSRRGPGSRERRRQGRVPPCRSGGRASGRDRRVGR